MEVLPFGRNLDAESLKPLLDKQVMVVLGGGKGDEGKGGDAYALASHGDYDLLVSSVGGPNAGHTVVLDDGRKFVGHNLPGSAVTGKPVFLGQGKYISIGGLQNEIAQLETLEIHPHIYLADGSQVLLESFHIQMDKVLETFRAGKGREIGTTFSGMGPGVATRGLRTGISIQNLLYSETSTLLSMVDELVFPFSQETLSGDKQIIIEEVLQIRDILRGLIQEKKVCIADNMFAQRAYFGGEKILIEGSQSPDLGMFGGAYPLNTSPDTSFLGNLSPLGINPTIERVGQLVVVKLFPSAVGNHIFPERVSSIYPHLEEKEVKFGKETGEFGSKTGRPRKIAFPSPALLVKSVRESAGYVTGISLRKFDMLPQFKEIIGLKELPIITGYDEEGSPILEMISYDAQEIVAKYKDMIYRTSPEKEPLFIAGFGPEPKNSRIV